MCNGICAAGGTPAVSVPNSLYADGEALPFSLSQDIAQDLVWHRRSNRHDLNQNG
jgi:hypothetical protein